MSKQVLAEGFAKRLNFAMQNAGFKSLSSKSGVSIMALTELTKHSRQICRKYLIGKTIPEPEALVKLAKKLNVSPGWLLFGDEANKNEENININSNLLAYILTHPQNPINQTKNVTPHVIPSDSEGSPSCKSNATSKRSLATARDDVLPGELP